VGMGRRTGIRSGGCGDCMQAIASADTPGWHRL